MTQDTGMIAMASHHPTSYCLHHWRSADWREEEEEGNPLPKLPPLGNMALRWGANKAKGGHARRQTGIGEGDTAAAPSSFQSSGLTQGGSRYVPKVGAREVSGWFTRRGSRSLKPLAGVIGRHVLEIRMPNSPLDSAHFPIVTARTAELLMSFERLPRRCGWVDARQLLLTWRNVWLLASGETVTSAKITGTCN